MRNIVANSFLVFGSLLGALVAGEFLMRAMTDFPISSVSHRIDHPLLNYVLDPASGDVDEEGFRNETVAGGTSYSEAAIGDSHTYGYNVLLSDSWPRQYAILVDKEVYNYGVPGYSVIEYYELIEMALSKRLSKVIVALFPRNDFFYCSHLNVNNIKKHHIRPICDYREIVWEQGLIQEAKEFLTANVALVGAVDYWVWDRMGRQEVSADPEWPWFMDLENDVIKGRVDEFLAKMKDYQLSAARHGVGIYLVLIPSKARMDVELSQLKNLEIFDRLRIYAEKERDLTQYILSKLQRMGYCAGDLSMSLVDRYQSSLEAGNRFYPTAPGFGNSDNHPLEAGYLAYAAAIREFVSSCH